MSDPEEKKTGGHTLADHLYGQNIVHEHGEDSDHDHDHDYDFEHDDVALEDNPLWRQDNVSLMTVGIDIGSSGTQVIFSRVNLRRMGEDLTSRYYVVSRETLFQSPVALTPYQSEERIDDDALGAIIDDAYNAANLHPDQIDTGVVILTGEALRRENAQGIAKILSEQGGEFVTATAGHHMEAMLAAYGSGAARGLQRRGQAHPQHRYRRRHHQARSGRERQGDRDCRRAYRRAAAGGRGWQDRAASIRPENTTPSAPDLPGSAATRSTRRHAKSRRRYGRRAGRGGHGASDAA